MLTHGTIPPVRYIPPNKDVMEEQNTETPMRLAWLFYLPMMAAGVFVQPSGVLYVPDWQTGGIGLAMALAGGVLTVWLSGWSGRRTRWGRQLREEFRHVLGPLSSRQILMLALLSSVGEEVLFRGILHHYLGLWWAALIFGFFHFPYRRGLLPWSVFALVLGVGMGWLTEYSGTLWPAIFLHFYINYFNLHDLVENKTGSDSTTDL